MGCVTSKKQNLKTIKKQITNLNTSTATKSILKPSTPNKLSDLIVEVAEEYEQNSPIKRKENKKAQFGNNKSKSYYDIASFNGEHEFQLKSSSNPVNKLSGDQQDVFTFGRNCEILSRQECNRLGIARFGMIPHTEKRQRQHLRTASRASKETVSPLTRETGISSQENIDSEHQENKAQTVNSLTLQTPPSYTYLSSNKKQQEQGKQQKKNMREMTIFDFLELKTKNINSKNRIRWSVQYDQQQNDSNTPQKVQQMYNQLPKQQKRDPLFSFSDLKDIEQQKDN